MFHLLRYVTDEVSVNGLKTYRYDLSSRNFESKKANGCYCPDPSKQIGNESICSFGGVQDVSTCERNVPLVLSMPHFVGASPELLQKYQGMEPNSSLHHSYMHIDPVLIKPSLCFRFQNNLHFLTLSYVSLPEWCWPARSRPRSIFLFKKFRDWPDLTRSTTCWFQSFGLSRQVICLNRIIRNLSLKFVV